MPRQGEPPGSLTAMEVGIGASKCRCLGAWQSLNGLLAAARQRAPRTSFVALGAEQGGVLPENKVAVRVGRLRGDRVLRLVLR